MQLEVPKRDFLQFTRVLQAHVRLADVVFGCLHILVGGFLTLSHDLVVDGFVLDLQVLYLGVLDPISLVVLEDFLTLIDAILLYLKLQPLSVANRYLVLYHQLLEEFLFFSLQYRISLFINLQLFLYLLVPFQLLFLIFKLSLLPKT